MNEHASPIILFDGVCNLCEGTVQWIIEKDRAGQFRFASLQSDAAEAILEEYQEPNDLDTVILVHQGKLYRKSDAALKVLRLLGGIYGLFYGFWIVPRFIRHRVYDWVAARRYRFFGKKEACMVPTPELRSRFLDE